MADKQSRESIEYVSVPCPDGVEGCLVNHVAPKPSKKENTLTVTVDVDVSEALTGLKALQREAKEATKALRELEAEAKREFNVHLNISPSQTKVMDVEQITEIFEKLSEAKRNR